MVGGRRPLLHQILGQPAPVEAKIADFEPIIARSASAVTPSEKSSINANRTSTTRFPMSLWWYVAPKSPKGGLKNARRPISVKIALRLKKVCDKVSLCENCQQHSCMAFIGVTNYAKNDRWGDPFYLKFWIKLTALERNRRFSIYFRS